MCLLQIRSKTYFTLGERFPIHRAASVALTPKWKLQRNLSRKQCDDAAERAEHTNTPTTRTWSGLFAYMLAGETALHTKSEAETVTKARSH